GGCNGRSRLERVYQPAPRALAGGRRWGQTRSGLPRANRCAVVTGRDRTVTAPGRPGACAGPPRHGTVPTRRERVADHRRRDVSGLTPPSELGRRALAALGQDLRGVDGGVLRAVDGHA